MDPLSESSQEQESSDTSLVIPSSSDFGDLPLYDFLRWHISVCEWCNSGENQPPPQFGKQDHRKCPEYFEIVQEYSDYERIYIHDGNP